ncbi:unnamed protein product [Peronospora destructor]|uniref:Uncharacterized protein n=1 Tax=Peronospora destructor TaxID=86335 RepID=A0AAV0UKM4_9STRA|nr:unnamed protein product [Peronospora destructor]
MYNLVSPMDYGDSLRSSNRLKAMNASEMIQEFNLTLPTEVIEEIQDEDSRSNTTQAYRVTRINFTLKTILCRRPHSLQTAIRGFGLRGST